MSVTVAQALRAAAVRLTEAGVPDAARDARLLMAEALRVSPDRLTPMASDILPGEAGDRLEPMIASRAGRHPVSHILGRRAFWGRDFTVTPDVLDPRPETEILIERALAGPARRRLLDLGTGSGAILVTLLAEWPEARGIGTDMSDAALTVAAGNARRHGVEGRADFRRADWFDGIDGQFDLIVSNPPYIPQADLGGLAPEVRLHEPAMALSPGPEGLEACRRIADGLARALAPSGRALIEIGAGQGEAARAVFASAGIGPVVLHPDFDGRDRVVEIRRSECESS